MQRIHVELVRRISTPLLAMNKLLQYPLLLSYYTTSQGSSFPVRIIGTGGGDGGCWHTKEVWQQPQQQYSRDLTSWRKSGYWKIAQALGLQIWEGRSMMGYQTDDISLICNPIPGCAITCPPWTLYVELENAARFVSVFLTWLVNHGRRLFLKALSNCEYSLV